MGPLPLLLDDEHFVAVDKPSGLLVHRQAGVPDEEAALQIVRDQIGQRVYPVHRLDRSTSGVLVFARSSEAARRLSEHFAAGRIDKRYLAVVRGVAPEAEHIDYALEGRNAVTELRRIDWVELDEAVPPHPTARYSLVELRPRTGRTHQLRRHLAHLRHPIVGDVRHGDGRHNRVFRRRFASHRLLLWATDLGFEHPITGARVELHAPPDSLDALGLFHCSGNGERT